jgi:uncharacterized membrane protein YdjX (TVP38/TMEM64 family)
MSESQTAEKTAPARHAPDAGQEPVSPWRARIKLILFVVAIAALLTLSQFFPVVQWLKDAVNWMGAQGVVGLVVLALLYVAATVLFMPGWVLTVGAGTVGAAIWPENPVLAVAAGAIAVSIGSVSGATAAFVLGRTIARDWVAVKVQGNRKFRAIDEAVAAQGLKMVFLIRLVPIFPFNLLNYAFGLTKVRLWHYVLGSWIGMLPVTIVYVYLGSVAGFAAAGGERTVAEWILLGVGLVALVVVVALVTRTARKALKQAMAEETELSAEEVTE